MGSASALRGMKRASTYSAARGAQLAYVQAVGVEVAAHNVQVNAIAQNLKARPEELSERIESLVTKLKDAEKEDSVMSLLNSRVCLFFN